MKRSSNARTSLGRLSVLLVGATLLGAAGCGEQAEDIEQTVGAISGNWTTLPLLNGWENYWGTTNAPAVGMVNGVVTFRGAIRNPTSSNDFAFILPEAFRPPNPAQLYLRVVMSGSASGTLSIDPLYHEARLFQDGVSPAGPGASAKYFTSLDGVTFDRVTSDATPLPWAGSWASEYPFRIGGNQTAGTTVKTVNGFVRFQGHLRNVPTNTDMRLFNIPSQFRPGQWVYVPVTLCAGALGAKGRLNISPSGDVYVQPQNGNNAAANCGTSLEGAAYSLSNSGTTLSLVNGWHPYSPRAVRVRNSGGVIRFEGAVSGGTFFTVTTLPLGMRPPTYLYLQADSYNSAHARIVVYPNGTVSFDNPSLSVATGFLSLDGVSFGL